MPHINSSNSNILNIFLNSVQREKSKDHYSDYYDKESKEHIVGKLDGLIVAVETVDDMTDRQIAAKVREYFQK